MGVLDRVVVGRLEPPPELEPPVAAELRLPAVARGLAVLVAVRAAGAGLEDTVVAATVTAAVSAGLAGVEAGRKRLSRPVPSSR